MHLPVHASWLNQAEIFFSILQRKVLTPNDLTDLDALTLSLARSAPASGDISTTAVALAVGILANTCLKLVVALVVGRGSFRTATAAVLGAMALALGVTLAW